MKKLAVLSVLGFLLLGLFGFTSSSEALTRVKGYTKKNGTYVMPSYRTSPNKIKFDNFSTKGNYNPYSGKKGYKKW
jgi:hypothetical protein